MSERRTYSFRCQIDSRFPFVNGSTALAQDRNRNRISGHSTAWFSRRKRSLYSAKHLLLSFAKRQLSTLDRRVGQVC